MGVRNPQPWLLRSTATPHGTSGPDPLQGNACAWESMRGRSWPGARAAGSSCQACCVRWFDHGLSNIAGSGWKLCPSAPGLWLGPPPAQG